MINATQTLVNYSRPFVRLLIEAAQQLLQHFGVVLAAAWFQACIEKAQNTRNGVLVAVI